MNIFKILSRGHGKISETNVSAFLGFLCDPYEKHGLSTKFLKFILDKVYASHKGSLKSLYINDVLSMNILKNYFIDIKLEQNISTNSRFDIIINIISKKNPPIENFTFYIELKINEKAVTKNQLNKYSSEIKQNYPNDNFDNIFLIYIALDNGKALDEFINSNDNSIKKIFISWVNIYDSLIDTIQSSSKGEIDPIHNYTLDTLKAFVQFINSNFNDDDDPKFMKYKIKIGEYEFFENYTGQSVRKICDYLIKKDIIEIELLSNIELTTNKLVLNSSEFERLKLDNLNSNKIYKGKKPFERYFGVKKESEIIKKDQEKYYVSTEITLEKLKNLVDEINFKINDNIIFEEQYKEN